MQLRGYMAVLASTVLVHAGTSQNPTPASLTVATPVGVVSACEGFSCEPLTIKANGGDVIDAYAFAPANAFYALFAGTPVDMCQPLPGFINNLAIWPIPVVFGVGQVPDGHPYPDPIVCGDLVAVRHTTGFPGWMIPGDSIRIQAMAFSPPDGDPTFSRAVDVVCR